MQEDYFGSVKLVLKGGFIIFLGSIISRLAGFFRQFIIIRMLSPDQYGLFALGIAFLNSIVAIGGLGHYIGAQRFIAFHNARQEYSQVRGTIIAAIRVILISGMSIFVLLFTFSGNVADFFNKPDFKIPLMILCSLIPVSMLNQIFISLFYGFKRAVLAETINSFAFSVASIIFIMTGLLIKRELVYAIIGFSVSYLLVLILAASIFWSKIWKNLKEYKPTYLGCRLFQFSLPLFFASVSFVILNQTDTLMLGYFATSKNIGLYNAAFILSAFIAVFLNSLGTMFMPVLTGLVATECREEAKNLYQTVTRWLFLLTLPLLLTFFLFPSKVLSTVFTGPYSQASLCLSILSLSEFLNTFLGPNSQALTAFGETKLLLVSWSTAAVSNIIMNYFFIQKWGINGAAIATGISLAILNFINSTFLYMKHKIHPFGRKYVVPVLFCFGAAAFLYFPLRLLVERSSLFILICYPLFLVVGIGFTLLTHSVSEEDLLVYRAFTVYLKRFLRR